MGWAMVVQLAFERTASTPIKYVVQTLSGPYVHTEIIVQAEGTAASAKRAYSAYMHSVFARTPERDFGYSDATHDFLEVQTSADESRRVWNTCEVCALTKVPYNLHDMVLSVVPLRAPAEKTIFDSRTLYCSQAMILILRSSLEKVHPLQDALAAINSRVASPTQLFHTLEPHCKRIARRDV